MDVRIGIKKNVRSYWKKDIYMLKAYRERERE
jgi:hypothetical protein